jgi:hypothetical protein
METKVALAPPGARQTEKDKERPSRAERKEYRAAENHIRESILLRDILPGQSYPGREEDLQTIHDYHSHYGIPVVGLWARAERLVKKGGS